MTLKNLARLDFPAENIKLTKIYENPVLESFNNPVLISGKMNTVYGKLNFPQFPSDRPYVYGSFVQSIDGRITFPDDPCGPLVAQKNTYDPSGGLADFWILNMLRASCDGILTGGGWTPKHKNKSEEMFGVDLEGGSNIYDEELEKDRIKMGLSQLPDLIVTSLDCTEMYFDHPMLNNPEGRRIVITTSPNGWELFQRKCTGKYYLVTEDSLQTKGEGMPVIVTGEGSIPDAKEAMILLKKLGYNKLLAEGPSYTHHLLVNGLMDELFLNTSGVYIGGEGLALGQRGKAATTDCHPHAEILSIHSHSPFFFYYRYRFHHNEHK